METLVLGLLAETAVHPGCGRDAGIVDLPVSREGGSGIPVIFGSGVKGAFRDKIRRVGLSEEDRNRLFGKQDSAGALLFSDARLLLLPVRSLSGHARWATCPFLLERFVRDSRRAGCPVEATVPSVERGTALASGTGQIFLEERLYRITGMVPADIVSMLQRLVMHKETATRLESELLVLHNDDFAWFAQYGLPVNARNVLEEDTKTSKNLWYEETLPADSILYALVGERLSGAVTEFRSQVSASPYVQMGGNETVGQGWFSLAAFA